MKKNIAIIPARAGSKGFPDKNIAEIAGKTLIELAINVAKKSTLINDIYISTDSKIYEDIAIKAGAVSLGLRSSILSGDDVKTIDVVVDLLKRLNNEYSYVILLQPTSPVRKSEDIDNMIREVERKKAEAAVSVAKIEEPHPYKMKKISNCGYVESLIQSTSSESPRQLLPEVYALNGAIYVIKMKALFERMTFLPKKTIPYFMSHCLNIDTKMDYAIITALASAAMIEIQTN